VREQLAHERLGKCRLDVEQRLQQCVEALILVQIACQLQPPQLRRDLQVRARPLAQEAAE
jgi:hypothetical protein